jgi:hypothetical protein
MQRGPSDTSHHASRTDTGVTVGRARKATSFEIPLKARPSLLGRVDDLFFNCFTSAQCEVKKRDTQQDLV